MVSLNIQRSWPDLPKIHVFKQPGWHSLCRVTGSAILNKKNFLWSGKVATIQGRMQAFKTWSRYTLVPILKPFLRKTGGSPKP